MRSWNMDDLDVVGYIGALEEPVLPRLLAPVFRERANQDIVLLPPFSRSRAEIVNPIVSNEAELQDLIAKETVVLLAEPTPCRYGHDLWVNPEGEVGYASAARINEAFANIFADYTSRAKASFLSGDFTLAAQQAAVARAVNPSHIEPLLIRGATQRMCGKTSHYNFTRDLAGDLLPQDKFDRMVAEVIESLRQNAAPIEAAIMCHSRTIMMGIARRRSAFGTSSSFVARLHNRELQPA